MQEEHGIKKKGRKYSIKTQSRKQIKETRIKNEKKPVWKHKKHATESQTRKETIFEPTKTSKAPKLTKTVFSGQSD